MNISASVGHGAYALGYQTAFDAGIVAAVSVFIINLLSRQQTSSVESSLF